MGFYPFQMTLPLAIEHHNVLILQGATPVDARVKRLRMYRVWDLTDVCDVVGSCSKPTRFVFFQEPL